MTCLFCGTELPAGAMFCGECGRPVAPADRASSRPVEAHPQTLTDASSQREIVFEAPAPPPEPALVEPGSAAIADPEHYTYTGPAFSAWAAVQDVPEHSIERSLVAEHSFAPEPEQSREPEAEQSWEAEPEPESESEPEFASAMPENPFAPVVYDLSDGSIYDSIERSVVPEESVAPESAEPESAEPESAEPAQSVVPEESAVPEMSVVPEESLVPEQSFAPEHSFAPEVSVPAAVLSSERCAQCGSPLAASDIFCPECGFVRQRASAPARPRDTVALDPFPWGLPREPVLPLPGDRAPVWTGVAPAAPVAPVAPAPAPVVEPVAPAVEHTPPAPEFADDDRDVDETRIVDRTPRGERFVLQFSTGESVSVNGTGLIGRNPLAEPGEYFDLLVTIVDPGRSVSKTHLEFGQEGGAFWISDRYSGNGTVVREPDRQPRRCDAGKRYRIARGTRVEIGEQFFIVS